MKYIVRKKISNPWDGKIEPFKIIGNVYFVGTFQASVHLIDAEKAKQYFDADILIDDKLWGKFLDFCKNRAENV